MPCMCGDICCASCGPAQGNWRCPLCGAWASDGCEHFETYCTECGLVLQDDADWDKGGHAHKAETRLRPEFQAQADEIARQEAESEAQLAKDLEESDRLAEEYWKNYTGEDLK